MGSVVHWLTFRGLHADRLEVFSADLWLNFRASPQSASGFEPTRLPLSPSLRSVPAGHFYGCHRRSSPWLHTGSELFMPGSWGSSWPRPFASRVAVEIPPSLTWEGGSLECSWWRPAPLILHALCILEPCQGSGQHTDLTSVTTDPSFWGVVSWVWEYGSKQHKQIT